MSAFRSAWSVVFMSLIAALIVTGCAKHPSPAERAAPMPALAATPEDGKIIVAKINGAEITKYAFIGMMNRIVEINEQTSTLESSESTKKRALDQLVLEELAIQEAERQNLTVDETVLDTAMQKNITYLGHEEGYRKFLDKQNMTTVEFRALVERKLLIQLIFSREVLSKVNVPEEDIRKEYERRKQEFVTPEKVTVVDVIIDRTLDDQAAIEKANELLSRINTDKDKSPRNLAVDNTFTVRSLELDKNREPELYNAARKLKEGELSGVIKTAGGMHILQLTAFAPSGAPGPYEEVKSNIEGNLRAVAMNKRRQEWEQELRKEAKIELLDVSDQAKQRKP